MLMKIGDVTEKFGISRRSLHYWESAGILKSNRAENDYRYYDEENLLKIKQIVLLRKLRLSIPSIQEVFTSDELSKVITVFTAHLNETQKETEQLNALGVVLRQLLNMLKDKQDMDSVYTYLDTAHSTETEELKAALKTVLAEPVKEISVQSPPAPVVDMTGVDLALEPTSSCDITEMTNVIKLCYSNIEDIDKLLHHWDLRRFNMTDCRWFYKIIQDGQCVGVISLEYVGKNSMNIRNIAYIEADNNVFLFELLRQLYPNIVCWYVNTPNDKTNMEDFTYDWEDQKRQFLEDNGFTFLTSWECNRYIKWMLTYSENNKEYYRHVLDGEMDDMRYRFSGIHRLDFYDCAMEGWRMTDCAFNNALIYDTGLSKSRFFKNTMKDCDFRYNNLENSLFTGGSLKNCKIENCDISGMTVDGINIEEALKLYEGKDI